MTTPARVLVVDDDTILRTVLCESLADEGYEVRPADNGRHALALLGDWTPDVIVLDLMMPGMDGWAFRGAQLGRRAVAHIPVIVLSATRDLRTPRTCGRRWRSPSHSSCRGCWTAFGRSSGRAPSRHLALREHSAASDLGQPSSKTRLTSPSGSRRVARESCVSAEGAWPVAASRRVASPFGASTRTWSMSFSIRCEEQLRAAH